MNDSTDYNQNLLEDKRFKQALNCFNNSEWYKSHDLFEDIWHETIGPERETIQGFLQIAVAQLHLESGNKNGATILYGEALGKLTKIGIPDLGIDLKKLSDCIEKRLSTLHQNMDPDQLSVPFLSKIDI